MLHLIEVLAVLAVLTWTGRWLLIIGRGLFLELSDNAEAGEVV